MEKKPIIYIYVSVWNKQMKLKILSLEKHCDVMFLWHSLIWTCLHRLTQMNIQCLQFM